MVSNNSTCPWKLHKPMKISLSVISALGLPGNLLVILLVMRAKRRKSSFTYLLLNLAIADFVKLFVLTTILALKCVLSHRMKRIFPVTAAISCVSTIVANFILALISFEKYNCMVRTMKPLVNITKKKIWGAIIASWFISFILTAPKIGPFLRILGKRKCGNWCCPVEENIALSLYQLSLAFFGHIIPLIVIVFCYGSILKGIYIDKTILRKIPNRKSLQEKKNFVHISLGVTVLFLVCNIPVIILTVLFETLEKSMLLKYQMVISIGLISSCLNPFVYGLKSKDYRRQIKEIFLKQRT